MGKIKKRKQTHGTQKLKFPIFLPALPSAREDCNPARSVTARYTALTAPDRPKLLPAHPCRHTTAIFEPWHHPLLRPGTSSCSHRWLQPCQPLLSPARLGGLPPSRAFLPSLFPALLPDPLRLHLAPTFPPFLLCKMLVLEHRSWHGSAVWHSLVFPWKTTKETDTNGETPARHPQVIPPALQPSAPQHVFSFYQGQAPDLLPAQTLPSRHISGTSPVSAFYLAFK